MCNTGPPGPPQHLKIENLTSSSCTLVWEPPSFDGGFEITRYRIERSSEYHSSVVEVNSATYSRSQVTVTKSERSTQVFSVASSKTQYTFKDLVEDTVYECRILAENSAGIGTSSDLITFIVSDSHPIISVASIPHRPGTPVVTMIDKDSVTIKWEAPASDGGAEITHYVVEARHVLVLLDNVTVMVY